MANSPKTSNSKFLCSYGGKILPRRSDGRLRYTGGVTRVVSVPAYTSFADLMAKLNELCGYSVKLRCQLPNEDLDVLVSINSDEDLSNVIEEYRKASSISGRELKIRAILSPPKSSSSSSSYSSSSSSSGADLSPMKINRIKPSQSTSNLRFQARKAQFSAIPNCHNFYACRLQASSRPTPSSPSPYFSQHAYNFWH